MEDFLSIIDERGKRKQQYVMARVVKTWGSSPRPIGSVLWISEHQEMIGSVSGGCVEGAVVKAAENTFSNHTTQLLNFGVSNEEAWEVGLSCGGKLEVFLQPSLQQTNAVLSQKWMDCLQNNQACILVTKLVEGDSLNSLVIPGGETFGEVLNTSIKAEAIKAFHQRKNKRLETPDGDYFIQVFARKSQLLIIGAAHIAVDLVVLAKMYGFETIVIDPRGTFAQKTQFKEAPDKIIEAYPSEVLGDYILDAYTYAVILSHDPKIDDNALEVLLNSEVAYIGALGSTKNQLRRRDRMADLGFAEETINRIKGPIGLNIHAKTAGEIALSIMAEIVQVKNS